MSSFKSKARKPPLNFNFVSQNKRCNKLYHILCIPLFPFKFTYGRTHWTKACNNKFTIIGNIVVWI